jgi:hypothetical protein
MQLNGLYERITHTVTADETQQHTFLRQKSWCYDGQQTLFSDAGSFPQALGDITTLYHDVLSFFLHSPLPFTS